MKSRKLLIGCGIVLALGLGVVLVGIIASYLFPKQVSSGTFAALVNINLPLNGAELPLNEPVSIYAEAVSDQPVHDLELWLDGAFSPTKMDNSPVDQSPISAVWLWTPAEEGTHRLMVRVIGPNGESVNSNVVRVSVLPREKIADLQVTEIPAELLPLVETPVAEVAHQPPEGPTATPPPPPFPPQDPPQVPAEPPVGAPGLQGAVNGCDAALLIQDNAENEKGFYLYRFDPTSTGFTRVATLDKHPGTGGFNYLDPGLSLGDHTYYIASFDGSGESPSNPINLKVTEPQCVAAGPQSFSLQDAMLTTTKAVDKVYCYLSVNQGPWTRIPPGTNKFIYPSAEGFDLGKYLDTLISPPPPGGVTLELECWGWSGDTLVYLGYLKQEVGKGPVQLIGTDFKLIGKGLEISVPETHPYSISPAIAPPYNVHFAVDVSDCIAHTGNVFQADLANDICTSTKIGFTILTWHWTPGCWFPKPGEPCPYTVADINGYHIYEDSPGNDPVQVTYVMVPKLHIAMIPPKSGGHMLIPPKYFVRAYKGSEESADSEHIQGVTPTYTATLKDPKLWLGTVHQHKFDGIGCPDDYGPEYYEWQDPGSDFRAGYYYQHHEITSYCDEWNSQYWDGHVVFDLSSIHGQVTGATLRWKWNGTFANGGGVQIMKYGCRIQLADQNGALISNYPLWGEDGYDVTTQVRAWVQGIPNKGFALLSGDHSLVWADNEACYQKYKDFELEVAHTGGP